MATNLQGARPTTNIGDTTVVDPTPIPAVTPTGIGGVAVYDRVVDRTVDPVVHTAMANDPLPVEARSTGSVMTWIIGAIVLILIAYFILQFIF